MVVHTNFRKGFEIIRHQHNRNINVRQFIYLERQMTQLTAVKKEISVLESFTYGVIHSPHQHPEQWIVRSKNLPFLAHCTEFLLLFHFAIGRKHPRNTKSPSDGILMRQIMFFSAKLVTLLP